ncbi:2074_t:CDS:2 [Acaulospora colombiana]|uniref:2074_t:CDS:1 n=1 Tax=Acaulospora colombiana TaxID=27376 RepID=A0ACA9M3N3_9GLOM|nr:2074_t:CDS:2 [Acaulospora colombiana]
MELHFSNDFPPYGEVAVYITARHSEELTSLKLIPNKKKTETTLTLTNIKPSITFTGSNIFRYLARSSEHKNSLYDETTLSELFKTSYQDDLLNLFGARSTPDLKLSLINESLEKRGGNYLIYPDRPVLADFSAWSVLKMAGDNNGKSNNHKNWIDRMDELKASKEAVELVDAAIKTGNSDSTTVLPQIKGADYENNKLDPFRGIVASMIAEHTGKSADDIFGLLELPRNPELGDITIAVPRLRVPENPVQLAQKLFVPNEYIIDASQVDHYLNFRYSHPLLTKSLLTHIYEKKEAYGTNQSGQGKTCVIDFSSPNIAKPFHAGLLAVGFEKYGSEEELLKNPIKHLYDVYVKINADIEKDTDVDDRARAYFKKMENGDGEALALWKKFRDLSIDKYKETYARLNIDFDVYSGESQISNERMQHALSILKEKNIVKESDGALIVDLSGYKLDVALIQKNDGTTLYITRDIGAAMERYEKYKFDAMYYTVASQQELHFKQLFKILELMGIEWVDRCKHINFGMVKGMSTRKGTAVFLDEILEQTKESMHEVMRQNEKKYSQIDNPEYVADVIGISAVMIQDMSAKRYNPVLV